MRVVWTWVAVLAAGLFGSVVIYAALQQEPVQDLPKPAVSSAR